MKPTRTLDDFDALPLFRFVRDGDPDTSHTAAAEAVATGLVDRHERMIAAGLRSGPASKCEIARRCGLTEQQVNRRLAELRRRGVIERTGRVGVSDSGHAEAEYRICDLDRLHVAAGGVE